MILHKCPHCEGIGVEPEDHNKICDLCKSTGEVSSYVLHKYLKERKEANQLKIFKENLDTDRIKNMSPDTALETIKQAFCIDQLGRGTNGHEVRIGNTVLFFSYDQLIGVELPDGRSYVMVNYWSSTTGGHINNMVTTNEPIKCTAPEFLAVLETYFS